LVNTLVGREQPLNAIDPRKRLPDRVLLRGAVAPTAPILPTVAVAGGQRAGSQASNEAPLHVTVVNGDLSFESAPLLLGHYAATLLTGTEAVMDRLIGGAMGRALRAGLYPLQPGSHQIFINQHSDAERGILIPRPEAVIVAGLGPEGRLQPGDLITTVRMAVIGWARRLSEPRNRRRAVTCFELASTLIGSGGTGISAGQAADLIIQGVQEANNLLLLQEGGENLPLWPRCGQLRLIELYLDRATEGWNAIRMREVTAPQRLKLAHVVDIRSGTMPRPADWGYRGADYDLITVQTKYTKGGECFLEHRLDTRRARSEVRGQRAQSSLLEDLIATAFGDQTGTSGSVARSSTSSSPSSSSRIWRPVPTCRCHSTKAQLPSRGSCSISLAMKPLPTSRGPFVRNYCANCVSISSASEKSSSTPTRTAGSS
jgi:hypothetical protein